MRPGGPAAGRSAHRRANMLCAHAPGLSRRPSARERRHDLADRGEWVAPAENFLPSAAWLWSEEVADRCRQRREAAGEAAWPSLEYAKEPHEVAEPPAYDDAGSVRAGAHALS